MKIYKSEIKKIIKEILTENFGSIMYNIPNMVCDKCGLPVNSCECQQKIDRNKNEKAVLPKGLKFMKEQKRHGQCTQDMTCPKCGAKTCKWCSKKDGTCDNHTKIKEISNLCKKCGNIVGSSQCKKYCSIKEACHECGTIHKFGESCPPGHKPQVKSLKKEFPKDSASPYKIAWATHKKDKGKH